MSASEKLKALDARDDSDSMLVVLIALPQIVAVVEAAEGIAGELPIDQGCHDMLYCVEFREALAALDEALS